MNRKLRKLMQKLEAAGAVVGMRDDVPDDIAEMFIRGVMECPDCAAAIANVEKQQLAEREEGGHRYGH